MTTGTLALSLLLLGANAAPPEPVVLNKPSIRVPINIDKNRLGEIASLVLFVSPNQGRTWNKEVQVPPDAGEFTLNKEDGLYWLSVGVVAKGSREEPDPNSLPVSQAILIDTVRPEVRAWAERQGDEIVVRWDVQDKNPRLETLTLEYRLADGALLFTPVSFTQTQAGQTTFQPRSASSVIVKMTIADAAKNVGSTEVTVPGGAAGVPALVSAPPPLPAPPPPSTGFAAPAPLPMAPPPMVQPAADKAWSAVPSYSPQARALAEPAIPPPPPVSGTSNSPIATSTANRTSFSEPVPAAVAPTPVSPRNARPELPPATVINLQKLQIQYGVAKAGPSGVGSVELYWTRDDGRTWQLVSSQSVNEPGPLEPASQVQPADGGVMPRTRAVQVHLTEEGIYGFYLVVKSRAGLGKPPPQPGTLPQMRVELDLTPPEAELYRPEPDPAQPGTLIVAWKATDNRTLAAKPIRLEWAQNREGPWALIGGGELPHTGRFGWRPQGGLYECYLRLTVRDTAGNVGVAETPAPVLVDLSEPEVIDIRLGAAR